MKKTSLLALYALLFIVGIPQTHAQAVLDSYVEEGMKANLALQREDFAYQKSMAALREAQGLFLPQVQLGASYMLAGGGRQIGIPVGDLLNPVYATLNQLTDTQRFPQIANVNEQFLPNNFHETKIRVVQPLFNPEILHNYRIKEAMSVSQEAQRAAYALSLKKEIKTAYYRLLQAEAALEVYAGTADLLKELRRVNESLIKNGKATHDALYDTDYEISKLAGEQAQAVQVRQSAGAYFNFLLNRPLDAQITLDSTLAPNSFAAATLEQGLESAMDKRPELRQVEAAKGAALAGVKLYRDLSLPQIAAVFDAGYQGFGYTFGPDQDFWLFNVALTWNLFNGKQNTMKRKQAQLGLEQVMLQEKETAQQLQLQVIQSHYQLTAANQSLNAAESAMRSAEEAYRLTYRRYTEGQSPLVQLTNARTNLTNARIAHAVARYEVLVREAEAEQAAGR